MSKAAFTRLVRSKINGLGCSTISRTHDDFGFFLALIDRHSEKSEKIGSGIDYFFISRCKFHNLQTWIKRLDGTETVFSWVHCCTQKKDTIQKLLTNAMRDSVSFWTIKFKHEAVLRCGLCDTMDEPYHRYHTDHVEPFRDLKMKFLETEDAVPIIFNKYEFRATDAAFRDRWISYHNKNASLQILCAKCNLAKH